MRLDVASPRPWGVEHHEIFFTSGGTESNNLAILGAMGTTRRSDLAISPVEHPSVARAAGQTRLDGGAVVRLDVDATGAVDPASVDERVDRCRLVSVQLANHETGVIQPVADIARAARGRGALVHVDAVQAFGKIPVHLSNLGVDLATITAHKIGGPIGIGVLFVRQGVDIDPLLFGGSQEDGLRPGSSPVPLAVAFAAAARDALDGLDVVAARHRRLRRRMVDAIIRLRGDAVVLTPLRDDASVANTLLVSFPAVDRESLLVNCDLRGVRISAGAACASGAIEPSPVLAAMNLPDEIRTGAIRISMGPRTDDAAIDALLHALEEALPRAARD